MKPVYFATVTDQDTDTENRQLGVVSSETEDGLLDAAKGLINLHYPPREYRLKTVSCLMGIAVVELRESDDDEYPVYSFLVDQLHIANFEDIRQKRALDDLIFLSECMNKPSEDMLFDWRSEFIELAGLKDHPNIEAFIFLTWLKKTGLRPSYFSDQSGCFGGVLVVTGLQRLVDTIDAKVASELVDYIGFTDNKLFHTIIYEDANSEWVFLRVGTAERLGFDPTEYISGHTVPQGDSPTTD